MNTTLADRVKAAIDEALAIDDHVERARELTGIHNVITDYGPKVRETRQRDVLTMKETMTYQAIGDALGVTKGRAEQIAKRR